jgi:hypothetical protein
MKKVYVSYGIIVYHSLPQKHDHFRALPLLFFPLCKYELRHNKRLSAGKLPADSP